MALSSFQLFLSQAQHAPGELKVQVLRVIMDLLIMYDQEFFGRSEDTVSLITVLKRTSGTEQNCVSRQREFSISCFRSWKRKKCRRLRPFL